MKKGRKSKAPFPPHQGAGHESIHFRLCHICLILNESDNPIIECQGCHRFFAADTQFAKLGEEQEEEVELEELVELGRRRPQALTGLTVLW